MEITPDDVEVRAGAHEELALAQGDGFAVALDTTLDDELRAEGIARELIRVINDTHGYPYGDDILRLVGAELRASIRSTDIAARVGGEEFKLILPDAGDARAQAIARRARSGVASISISGANLSCSAGIAIYPADAGDD